MAFLELKDITRKYKLGQVQVTALGGVSLSIEEGEYVSIMGPSGSGKSTLLNIIGCLDLPSSGTYLFDGKHIESLKDGELADLRNRRIGFVFQQFHLLPNLTAIENVELPLIYQGYGERSAGSGQRRRWSRWASGTGYTTCPSRCRGASSRGWPYHGP